MILVALGTQDKGFPRLIEAVETQVKLGNIKEKVIVQAGSTKYKSDILEIFDYIPIDEFKKHIENARVIITHSGVGTIISGLNNNKKLIVAPRLKKYKEHVNDHQLQILENFSEEGYVLPLVDFSKLEEVLKQVETFTPKEFVSNNENFLEKLKKEIDKYLI